MPPAPPPAYAALTAYLASRPADVVRVIVPFPELERLLGAPLPRGVYRYDWWSERATRPHAMSWRAAGWRVAHLALRVDPPAVTFARRDSAP